MQWAIEKHVTLLHNGKKLSKSSHEMNKNGVVTQGLLSTTHGILPLKGASHATTIFLTLNFICYTWWNTWHTFSNGIGAITIQKQGKENNNGKGYNC